MRSRMRSVVFNGKFYGAGLNGVHRVADRLIREVDALLAAAPVSSRLNVTLVAPAKSSWLPHLKAIRIIEHSGAGSQRWEQTSLPRFASGSVLVNLCNLAPIFHRRKILLLHDAQFLFPDSSYPTRLRWGYRLATPLMTRTSAQVLTVSEYSRQILSLTGVSPIERTSVVHNGADHMLDTAVNLSVVPRLGLGAGKYVVLFGSPKRYKNVQIVFDAFNDNRLFDLRLVVVGPSRDRLESSGLTPPASAVFVGSVDDGALRALYSDALCVAFPSRTEGFGLPPIEAAFCGCPAVVSPAGAIPEICRDATLYAGVDSASDWAEAIHVYASQPTVRADKAKAAMARAQDFRWSAAGEKLLSHIYRLAG